MFGSNTKKLNWKTPSSITEFEEMLEDAMPVVIFKHSERCSISRFAFKQFENEYDSNKANLVFIEVRENRDLSNYIAGKWSIEHQSPQIIVRNTNGNHFSASHENISAHKAITFLSV